MRIITSYAYTLDVETAEEAALRFGIYRGVMDDWLRDQGISNPRGDSPADTYIQLTRRDVEHEGAEIDGFLLKQPILESSHLLHTRFDLAVADQSLALFLQFSIERRTNRISPASYPVSCPRALQTILDAGNWKSGQARVRPHSRQLFGREAGASLRAEIADPDRNLPIVLMANFPDNRPLGEYQELIKPYNGNDWEDFINRVEDDLGGVALLVELDSASDASLLPPAQREPATEEPQAPDSLRILKRPRLRSSGRRAMCGAVVRIIWPLGTDEFDQVRHPAWAPYELFANEVGIFFNDDGNNTEPPEWMRTFEQGQLMLLRRHIRDTVYEQAALQPPPDLIEDIRQRYAKAEHQRVIESRDFDALESLYEEELAGRDEKITSLQRQLEAQHLDIGEVRDESAQLEATIKQLQFQLKQAKGGPEADGHIKDAAAAPEPSTVAEAIDFATSQCMTLRFGPHATDKLDSLSPSAGPPRKILNDLKSLDQCGQLLQHRESLGKDVIAWLIDQNVNASRESSTRMNKYAAELTFPTARDTYELMGHHIKYGGGLGKDMEARIHFSVHQPDDGEGATIDIGYVGPKIMPD